MDMSKLDLEERLRGEAQQEGRDRALIESMFRAARERQRQGEQAGPPPSAERPKGVHYTELPEAQPGEALGREWNTYRLEVGRLLAEGQAGRFVLIKGEEILGLYDSWEAAREVGLRRFLLQPFLVHPIRAEEPYLRIRGVNLPWPNSRSQ
jgi:hypothetical protein